MIRVVVLLLALLVNWGASAQYAPKVDSLFFTGWTTANRPVAPLIGQCGYNVTSVQYECWSGIAWYSTAQPTVTDGVTSVPQVGTIQFTAGCAVANGGGGIASTTCGPRVSDGTTTVTPASSITFTSGCIITSGGGGLANAACGAASTDTVTATNGLNARTLAAWMGDTVNVLGQNVTGDGSTNDAAALLTAAGVAHTNGNTLFIPTPPVSYNLNSNVTVTSGDLFAQISLGYVTSGTGVIDFNNQVPYQHTPIFAFELMSKTYGSSWDGYASGNVFQLASIVTNNNTAGTPTVALYGQGVANKALGGTLNNSAWGINAVGVANVASSNAFAAELDCVALNPGITGCVGASINAAGTSPSTRAIDIRANSATSGWNYGVNFTLSGSFQPVIHSLLVSNGAVNPENFINFLSGNASLAEIDIPSFRVDATKISPLTRWQAKSGTTATGSPSNATTLSVVSASGVGTSNGDGTLGALGTGAIWITNANGNLAKLAGPGSTIANYFRSTSAATAGAVVLAGDGTDTDINMIINPKGAGALTIQNTNGASAQFTAGASTISRLQVAGAASGSPVSISVGGTATDLSINSGASNFIQFSGAGSFSANGAVATALTAVGPTGSHTTVQEWLTFKNASGTVRYVPAF